jgi:hypothetical protein
MLRKKRITTLEHLNILKQKISGTVLGEKQ